MDERALFVKFWEHEAKTTHTVLTRIPEGSTYKPDPKSRTAQQIAWQIVCEEKMIIEALETGKADMLAVVKTIFPAIDRIVIARPESTPAGAPRRVTEEEIREQRMASLRKADPVLGAAIDALDLELLD